MIERRLLLGDCLDIMPTLAAGSIDMVLADLPYGTTQNSWDSVIPLAPLWQEYWRIVSAAGVIALTASQPFTSVLIASQLRHFKYTWVWHKSRPSGHMNAKKQPLREHEDICIFYRAQPTYSPQFKRGRPNHVSGKPQIKSHSTNHGKQYEHAHTVTDIKYPTTILPFTSVSQTHVLHPTQKPVDLMEYLIRTYTNEGDTVLDNTMGSGTTGVACATLGRKFIGIEISEEYFQIAEDRIRRAGERPDQFALFDRCSTIQAFRP